MKTTAPEPYPDTAYSESGDLTYRVRDSQGGRSLRIWPMLLLFALGVLFLFIKPWISAALLPVMVMVTVVSIAGSTRRASSS